MNELIQKIEGKIEHVKSLKSTARHTNSNYLMGEINALQDVLFLLQSQPINKEFGALNKQEKEFEDDSDLHKMRAEIDIFKKEFESEFKRLEALEPSKEPKEFNPFERIKELEKENEQLKQVYKHRCNEVKDKVETIHKYLNQITQLQKKIEEIKRIINVGSKEVIGKIDVAAKDSTHKRFDSNEHAFRTGWIDGRGLYVMEQLTKLSELESLTNKTDE